eukprot:XP_020404459.1 spidroin-1-like [Zea mays]
MGPRARTASAVAAGHAPDRGKGGGAGDTGPRATAVSRGCGELAGVTARTAPKPGRVAGETRGGGGGVVRARRRCRAGDGAGAFAGRGGDTTPSAPSMPRREGLGRADVEEGRARPRHGRPAEAETLRDGAGCRGRARALWPPWPRAESTAAGAEARRACRGPCAERGRDSRAAAARGEGARAEEPRHGQAAMAGGCGEEGGGTAEPSKKKRGAGTGEGGEAGAHRGRAAAAGEPGWGRGAA